MGRRSFVWMITSAQGAHLDDRLVGGKTGVGAPQGDYQRGRGRYGRSVENTRIDEDAAFCKPFTAKRHHAHDIA